MRWCSRTFVAQVAMALLVLLAPGHGWAVAQDTGQAFTRLFEGTLKGWVVENTAGNFSVADGLLRVEGPSGWLRSERRYEHFAMRIEFRFLTADADSGIFLRAPDGPTFGRGWPNNSYQVQLRVPSTPSRLPPLGGIFRHDMPAGDTAFDASLVEKLFGGVAAWQTVEIDVDRDVVLVRFNGTRVTRAANIAPSSGFIGIQGEAGALEFRAIEIRER